MIEQSVDEVDCKRASCRSSDVVFVYEPLFGVGDITAQHVMIRGAECRSCGLRFVTDQVRELASEYRPDPDGFTIDRNI